MTHTKNAQIKAAYRSYKHSSDFCLEHVYGSYSQAKANAWEYCRQEELRYSGYDLKVITHNTMIFTAGFIGSINGKLAFFYITPCYDRYIYLDEIAE